MIVFRKKLLSSLILLTTFILWTLAVCILDVQSIGPLETNVGLARLNACMHNLTGVHFPLYTITDWLGLIPIFFALGFALLGLKQWILRRSLLRVDFSILALGVFYFIVAAVYLFFESCIINYRPVLIEGCLEASYPSSTTLLTLCVMPTSILQLNRRVKNQACRRLTNFVLRAFTAFMVIVRFISGVHWFSDIVGGILLSSGLVAMYAAALSIKTDKISD